MPERSREIFGNAIDEGVYAKAVHAKERYLRRFGPDAPTPYPLSAQPAPVIGQRLGATRLLPAATTANEGDRSCVLPDNAVVVGNIRMGFGHYRIAMAMASAAHAKGYAPLWLDLCAFPDTLATKIIQHQNSLYTLGSRLSQAFPPFNTLYWEPLNSEGFRKLAYNAQDQKVAELFTTPLSSLPVDVPYVGTHAWCAQAAVHAGFTHVVNAIPDNWPMALHLAEGSTHAVQTPFAYQGYSELAGMDPSRALQHMPKDSIVDVGHYIDHELVANIDKDCARRTARMGTGDPVRYLVTVGGAGAQFGFIRALIEHLIPLAEENQAAVLINVGDHRKVWGKLAAALPALADAVCHFDDFDETEAFAEQALDGAVEGIHAFCHDELFGAVYSTNLLMRCSDVVVTKPSELAFYPVPKLLIRRVGGHEAFGAIRAAELGEGTIEMETPAEACAMIDAIQQDRSIITGMCTNICAEARRGTYDGAYRVIDLATRGTC